MSLFAGGQSGFDVPARQAADSRAAWLVVGADGTIGGAMLRHLVAAGMPSVGTRLSGAAAGCLSLDLNASPDRWTLPSGVSVACLAAAVTSLDACRQDPISTRRINVDATLALADRLVASGAFVIFLSSNLVYDGSLPRRRAEDPPCPTTEYGRQKADAEQRLLALGDRVAVVRLTKVLSADTPLLAMWRAALRENQVIHPFADMVMAPVGLPLLVGALCKLGELQAGGIFQLSADRDITYERAALRLAERLGASLSLVQPIECRTTGALPDPPPRHTTLDASRCARELGIAAPDPMLAVDLAGGCA